MTLPEIYPIPLAVFAIFGIVIQIPVLLVQAIGPAPNLPITVLSLWFLYLNISTFINSILWTNKPSAEWPQGDGWCDIDTNVFDASSLGILLATLTISSHLFYMSRPSTRKMQARDFLWWNIFDIAVCFAIPVAVIIVHPFMTTHRYVIVENVGCRHIMVLSPAVVFFHCAIPFLLTLLLLGLSSMTLLQFYWRGTESVYQALSFKERFSVSFFWRSTVCCLAIIVTCVPLVLYNAIENFTSSKGVEPLPWIHGKPDSWDNILGFLWVDVQDMGMQQPIISSVVFRVMIIVLSFVSFFCFGTGSSAVMFYRNPFGRLRSRFSPNQLNQVTSPVATEYSSDDKGKVVDVNVHISERTVQPPKDGDFAPFSR